MAEVLHWDETSCVIRNPMTVDMEYVAERKGTVMDLVDWLPISVTTDCELLRSQVITCTIPMTNVLDYYLDLIINPNKFFYVEHEDRERIKNERILKKLPEPTDKENLN